MILKIEISLEKCIAGRSLEGDCSLIRVSMMNMTGAFFPSWYFGGQFTSKMVGMLNDVTVGREQQTKFEEYISNNPQSNPRVDLSVTILTTGHWPSYKRSDINLPSEMVHLLIS